MLESSARRPLLRNLLCVGTLLVAAGCSGKEEKAAPPPDPTPLASLNTASVQVPRIEFCQLVPDAAVSDALGGEPDADTSYGNGDEQDLAGLGTEVVHEIGCTWSTDAGATASAWVFARPVDAAYARTIVASARQTAGCRTERGEAFGQPSLTQVCRLAGGEQRVRHAGLFGQTWLTCEVGSRAAEDDVVALRERSDPWCVEVVNALNTSR